MAQIAQLEEDFQQVDRIAIYPGYEEGQFRPG